MLWQCNLEIIMSKIISKCIIWVVSTLLAQTCNKYFIYVFYLNANLLFFFCQWLTLPSSIIYCTCICCYNEFTTVPFVFDCLIRYSQNYMFIFNPFLKVFFKMQKIPMLFHLFCVKISVIIKNVYLGWYPTRIILANVFYKSNLHSSLGGSHFKNSKSRTNFLHS